MKKILAMLLAAMMILSLAACGAKAPAEEPAPAPVEVKEEIAEFEQEMIGSQDATNNTKAEQEFGDIPVRLADWRLKRKN